MINRILIMYTLLIFILYLQMEMPVYKETANKKIENSNVIVGKML